MKKILFLFSSVLLYLCSGAQDNPKIDITVSQDQDSDIVVKKKGFEYMSLGWGFVLDQPPAPGANLKPISSHQFYFGYRYYFNLSKFYLPGIELNYEYVTYKLKQDSAKIFPNNILHDKEQFNVNSLNLDFTNRIVFKKKRGAPFVFMDIAGYGGWIFATTIYTVDNYTVANAYNASKVQVYHRNLVFTEDFQYGVKAIIGINGFLFYGQYRFSNLIKSGYIYPQMPNWLVGIGIELD